MYFGNTRNQLLILNISTILIVFLLTVSFWNTIQKGEEISYFSIAFLVVFILVQLVLFKKQIDVTNEKRLANFIHNKIYEAKHKREKEQKEKEIIDNVEEKKETSVEEQLKVIVPSNSFKKLDSYCSKLLVNLSNHTEALRALMFISEKKSDEFKAVASFAIEGISEIPGFKIGETLNGQAAQSQDLMIINEIPEDYVPVESGLGKAQLSCLVIVPIQHEQTTIGVIELGYYKEINAKQVELLKNVVQSTSKKINELINS